MTSTYSSRLKLELQGTGENAGTWGDKTNNNLDVLDAFAAGYLSKSVAGSADVTLTTANASATAESSNKVIELTGTLTGDIKVFIPAKENNYIFFNNTAGSHTVTVAATGHTANGVAIVQGDHANVYCDGASDFNVKIASQPTHDAAQLTTGTLANARLDAQLQDIAGLSPTDSNFIVGDGSNFVLETGATARTSLGLGNIATQATDSVAFTGGTATGMTSVTSTTITASTTFAIGANWTVVQSGNNLQFNYDGTGKMKLDENGNLTCVGDVTASGTI